MYTYRQDPFKPPDFIHSALVKSCRNKQGSFCEYIHFSFITIQVLRAHGVAEK